jgi:hypothetical protein
MDPKIKLSDLIPEGAHENGTTWRTRVKGPASTSEETGPWTNADKFAAKNKKGWTRYFGTQEAADKWAQNNDERPKTYNQ